jgi:prepilin-type N-terminal cleavage/methylation domain-containing protein
MPTSSVGRTSRGVGTDRSVPTATRLIVPSREVLAPRDRRGITLIEMLIVMALIALVVGMAAPSLSSGLDSLRLRSTSDAMIGFFNTALARAETRQQVVEILVSPQEGTLTATSADQGFKKRLEITTPIKILAVRPSLAPDGDDQGQTRRFLVYPGGAVPKIGIEIGNSGGRKRLVSIDPVTGVPQSVLEGDKKL